MLRIKTFQLPIDSIQLNEIINRSNVEIIDKKIFYDGKAGYVLVYLEYEELEVSDSSV